MFGSGADPGIQLREGTSCSISHFAFPSPLPRGLMLVEIVEREEKTKTLAYLCLYSFSTFHHDKKLAYKNLGVHGFWKDLPSLPPLDLPLDGRIVNDSVNGS